MIIFQTLKQPHADLNTLSSGGGGSGDGGSGDDGCGSNRYGTSSSGGVIPGCVGEYQLIPQLAATFICYPISLLLHICNLHACGQIRGDN